MFVLLHLHAAVVDLLDAAQVTHLFIDAEILDSTADAIGKHSICVEVDKNI